MRILIGCLDGREYCSDHQPDSLIQAELDKVDGDIGTGFMSGKRIRSPRGLGALMSEIIDDAPKMSTAQLTLTINGVDRVFNAKHIVWYEITYDDQEDGQ